MSEPLIRVEGVEKRYRLPRGAPWRPRRFLTAVGGVDFTLETGRSLGVVGESGSGKSTLARLVMALERPDAGRVLMLGRDLFALPAAELRAARRDFQMVFQDPYGSLDPRHRVARIVAEPFGRVDRATREASVAEALDAVGLRPADAAKYPHEFSGGQRQRIAIARALVTKPRLIVADEPVSALDVSVQAQVLNLMQELRLSHGIGYLFIGHDLAVVGHATDEVAVMYRGRFVETGPTREVFAAPYHPYTEALKEAVPRLAPGRRRERLRLRGADGGTVEAPPMAGCAYQARCPRAEARCRAEAPVLREVAPGRRAACHLA